jgi:hypothetical protein
MQASCRRWLRLPKARLTKSCQVADTFHLRLSQVPGGLVERGENPWESSDSHWAKDVVVLELPVLVYACYSDVDEAWEA